MRAQERMFIRTRLKAYSLLKRGMMGTFHSVSRKHPPNYRSECEFWWNTRRLDDGQRMARAIKQVDGERLEYRESVENLPYLVREWEWRVKPKQADAPFYMGIPP